jgi:hypothetical protein
MLNLHILYISFAFSLLATGMAANALLLRKTYALRLRALLR